MKQKWLYEISLYTYIKKIYLLIVIVWISWIKKNIANKTNNFFHFYMNKRIYQIIFLEIKRKKTS